MTFIPADTPMEAVEIDEGSIISGTPKAATTILRSAPDGSLTVGIFTCTPGKFRFDLEWEEITYLLAGHVVIELDNGQRIDASAGDTYILPAGVSMVIDVREEIRDMYVSLAPSAS